MQQGGDSLVLVSTLFENDTRHRQQMRDIWNGRSFTSLVCVQPRRKGQGILKTCREFHDDNL